MSGVFSGSALLHLRKKYQPELQNPQRRMILPAEKSYGQEYG
jgi:hypothetical protein